MHRMCGEGPVMRFRARMVLASSLLRLALLCLVLPVLSSCTPERAKEQSAEEFFKGKTVTIMVGFSPSGLYDDCARVIARHIGRHIPGHPSIVVQNMPGAGGLVAANYVHNSGPRD